MKKINEIEEITKSFNDKKYYKLSWNVYKNTNYHAIGFIEDLSDNSATLIPVYIFPETNIWKENKTVLFSLHRAAKDNDVSLFEFEENDYTKYVEYLI